MALKTCAVALLILNGFSLQQNVKWYVFTKLSGNQREMVCVTALFFCFVFKRDV